MLTDFLLASAHHILLLSIVASLTAELVLLRGPLDKSAIRRLVAFDTVYGASAVLIVVIGVLRLIYGLKGWEFYSGNHAFWTKMGLFAAVGLLSIVPTMQFMRWRRALDRNEEFEAPRSEVASIRRFLHLEALLLLAIPVAAAAMARGL